MSVSHALARELIALATADHELRQQLVRAGALHDDYHPQMEQLLIRNGNRLGEVFDAVGWPSAALVGEEAAEAAWLILQHSISLPQLMRRGLALLESAQQAGEVEPWRVAMLEDRIRVFEGRPQIYGTQLDWGAGGELEPHRIEDMDGVDARRHEIGLDPLDEAVIRKRQEAACNAERPPADAAAKQARYVKWLRDVGWRD